MNARSLTVPDGYELLVHTVERTVGVDLRPYTSRQLFRRLESFRLRHGAPDLAALARRLAGDPALQQAFAGFLTINVTEFFRNPEQWDRLRRLLPALAPEGGAVRAWSAGCSTGAEPYSLAMLLDEVLPGGAHRILATDIDAEVLARARAGRYHRDEVVGIPEPMKRRHLQPDGDHYQIRAHLQERVAFRQHDLLRDRPPGRFNLVLCRNVTIYFNADGRHRAHMCLTQALTAGGLLFIGATETILHADVYGLRLLEPGFYRKIGSPQPT